ncbi:uncharacterized protein LOC121398035 [Xenopus laevis]|uniref:Uncharacterized protein LOC121398035 n=1 Tax=Xenopus laevis TaxID=8355 RepID=A0A8J1LSW6_XENLA|nr:uncharacterized protein LOC121398035 [Xenopus laevis]
MSVSRASSYKTRSRASCSSKSSIKEMAALARAEAEAAKVKSSFAAQEMQLKKERASLEKERVDLQASLERLAAEKEAAAAIAKAEYLEALEFSGSEKHSRVLGPDLDEQDPAQRVSEYVHQHPKTEGNYEPGHQPAYKECQRSYLEPQYLRQDDMRPNDADNYRPMEQRLPPLPRIKGTPFASERHYTDCSKPEALKRYGNTPHVQHNSTPDCTNANWAIMDFAKFYAKRELVTKGLTKFTDQAENYRSWRASFQNAIRDLDLSHQEELDLLVKWLGSESVEHAKRIRDININYPDRGLKMVWERLDECYGSIEAIENALFKRIDNFPRIVGRGYQKLRELSDLLREVQVAQEEGDLPGLAFLDTARGVNPIVQKLPHNLQEKWVTHGSTYKRVHNVPFPPFEVFVNFVSEQARIRNDPSFDLTMSCPTTPGVRPHKTPVAVHKTNIASTGSPYKPSKSSQEGNGHRDLNKECPLHKKPHSLLKCRAFREKTLEDRKEFLKDNNICFRCCTTTSHFARNCEVSVSCSECGSTEHNTALHPGPPSQAVHQTEDHEKKQIDTNKTNTVVTSQCTEICKGVVGGKSCSKICLVRVYPASHRDKAIKAYAILDDQSNRSLAKSTFFDTFNIIGPGSPYSLRTCAGTVETAGRKATGYKVESIDGQTCLSLPTILECNQIPDNRSEIPTPEVAAYHPHLKRIAHQIPELDPEAPIALLLGRDILRVHKARGQINGSQNAPYAQRLDLGWVIIGDVCLGGAHKPISVNSMLTNTLESRRPSLFQPCQNSFLIKEMPHRDPVPCPFMDPSSEDHACDGERDHLGCTVFHRSREDNKVAMSIEDRLFLEIMNQGMTKDKSKSWVAPLPFRPKRQRLPDNKELVYNRFISLKHKLQKTPEMKEHFFTFMERIFQNNHAEMAPALRDSEERWYLPTFGVYHPKKPGQIRVVFDSSARCKGLSLNDVLLSGPDLNNRLLEVLLRFRKDSIAFMADIQQMFHCFLVKEEHRNYLRFFWYRNNDPNEDIVEYRMRVHIFGNSPSPAVAIYGLRLSAQEGEAKYGSDARSFVEKDFYVDDCLKSTPTNESAISLLKRTQEMLALSNLRLHKIASNSRELMEAFSNQDHASDLKDLDLDTDSLPMQRSLGLLWDLKADTFTFQINKEEKPFTRRGVLSTINSLYDPLGFVTPVTIQGKIMLRDLTTEMSDWDDPLPTEKKDLWTSWKKSLEALTSLHVTRPYASIPSTEVKMQKLHIFCDASIKAIAAVAYLKTIDAKEQCHVGFVMSRAKLTPLREHTIPRLELCAAVLAVELAELITSGMGLEIEEVEFHTDSKVVLGYICNEIRRFYVYVSNRVLRIRRSTSPQQWHYVPTQHNPADYATRSVAACHLKATTWFTGPAFLYRSTACNIGCDTFELIDPDADEEIRPEVSVLNTVTSDRQLESHRFSRFSTWMSLVRAIAILIHIAFKSYTSTLPVSQKPCKGWHHCKSAFTASNLERSKDIIIHTIQHECYTKEIEYLRKGQTVSKDSALRRLDPVIDQGGLMRIGGRLQEAKVDFREKHPIVIPGHHHVATLLIRHHHLQTKHQGRMFTEGNLRAAGLWIVGAKRRVSQVIFNCITCRKLRGVSQNPKMASLPAERLSTDPPFTNVGLDVFGPWSVATRHTRGVHTGAKRWAVMFTCMSSRAVHIEVIESMDASSFINAFRRFIAIRGPVKCIRSDRGTNFVGAVKELQIPSNLDTAKVDRYLNEQGCTWTFNPPHSSHMGGVWERMIGIARKILDSIFSQVGSTRLTHESLVTFLAEVSAIMNARPLTTLSSDPEDLTILTPAMLLTQKTSTLSAPSGEFTEKDLYRRQWRQVQSLSNVFWDKWRKEYVSTLQSRRKWQTNKPNIRPGDVVLMKDHQSHRNEWPLGLITNTFPSKDGNVRKAEVKICKLGECKLFLRPTTELVLLFSPEKTSSDIC